MGSKNKMQDMSLVPKLRFPEFNGWPTSLCALGTVATFHRGIGVAKKDLAKDGTLKCIRYGELYTIYGELIDKVASRTNLSTSNLALSELDDVIIPTSGETKEDIATAACVRVSGVALGSDLTIIRSAMDGRWLSYYVNGALSKHIRRIAQGDLVVHLYPAQLANIRLAIPKSVEQQKVADCLTSLNERIAAETCQLQAWQIHKQGLLRRLFPRPTETLPAARLSGFSEPWHITTLGQAAQFLRGKGLARADIVSNGATPCIRYGELYTAYGEVINNVNSRTNCAPNTLILSEVGDVIIPTSGETKEDIATASCVMMSGVALGSDLILLRSPNIGAFLSYYIRGTLRESIARVAQGDAVVHLYANQLRHIRLALPGVGEQQRIVDCLASLNDLIAAQARKIDLLKQHKKGLMQQLFAVPDEAAA